MSILCLELVVVYMLVKFENYVSLVLVFFFIIVYYNWVDSIIVFCWLVNCGEWIIFVCSWVKVIGELIELGILRYVFIMENFSDFGIWGLELNKFKEFWLKGLSWLLDEFVRFE